MFNSVLSYIREGIIYAGLEVHELQGQYAYRLLELQKKNQELVVSKTVTLAELDEIPNHLKKSVPVIVVINGSQVLIKKAQNLGNVDPKALVDSAFPNLALENFYFEIIQKEVEPIIAISKKKYVDGILDKLKGLKLDLVQFSIGISSIHNVLPHLKETTVYASSYQLEIEEKRVTGIAPLTQNQEVSYTADGLELSNRDILTFSAILGYLARSSPDSNFISENNAYRNGFENKRTFNMILRSALLFFLPLLLLNFFVFNHYFNEVENLKASLEHYTYKINTLKELEVSVNRKQERVAMLNSSSNSRAALYLDKLARKVPATVLLDKCTFQPLKKPMQKLKPVRLEEHQILVSGTSNSGDNYSKWVMEMEGENWISSVETMDYDYISSGTSNFLIKIVFREKQSKK